VAATDITGTRDNGVLRADLTDYGQELEVLHGADAVVHLANIPAPGLATPAVTFNANMTMSPGDYQRFPAARSAGLRAAPLLARPADIGAS
jgi:hypothetical protein